MKNSYLYWLGIITVLIILNFWQYFTPCPKCPDVVKVDTVWQDTGTHSVTYLPKPYPVFTQHIDTGTLPATDINLDYYTLKVYNDTLKNDSSAFISLVDSVYWNALQGRGLIFVNRQPHHVTHTVTVPEPDRWRLYAGGFACGNTGRFGLGPSLAATKGGLLFTTSCDLLNREATAGIHFKLHFK